MPTRPRQPRSDDYQRAHCRRIHPWPAWSCRHRPRPPATSSTPPRSASQSACSAPKPPNCSVSTSCSRRAGLDHRHRANGNGGAWLHVAGILNPDVLSPGIDSSVLVGYPFVGHYLSFSGSPTTIYVRATGSRVRASIACWPVRPTRRIPVPSMFPALQRPGRPGRRQEHVQHPVARPRRSRPAGRRHRRGQPHGDQRPGAPARDWAAPPSALAADISASSSWPRPSPSR
jgi:hypothetical protein